MDNPPYALTVGAVLASKAAAYRDAAAAAAAMSFLADFIGRSELAAIRSGMRGEERQFFVDKVCELQKLITDMPGPYGQDGKGDDAIVHLHYFNAGFDWYITERDDLKGEPQLQAFGLARMHEEELGYIAISELIAAGVELDLYWKPKRIGDVRKAA